MIRKRVILALGAGLACVVTALPLASAAFRQLPPGAVASASPSGSWRRLPAAPIAPNVGLTSVWTSSRMLLFGRVEAHSKGGNLTERSDVAATYDPVPRRWRRVLAPMPTRSFTRESAAWTGREAIVWGPGTREAFNPRSGRWRRLPTSPSLIPEDGSGLVAWTGHELVGWGGGCCGDASSHGVAYVPATNSWRALARSPLAGSQRPRGAWTGRELLVFVGNLDPDGRPWPASLARGAAYDPASDTWRRLAPAPVEGGAAVWDGSELLVVGAGAGARSTLAYDPKGNRWRRLAPLPSGRVAAAIVWTGRRLLLWGGATPGPGTTRVTPAHGLAYDPRTNRWSALSVAPLAGRAEPTAVWTGHAMIVWGGSRERQQPRTGLESFTDGAAFTPTRP